ncbi:MAG: CapA family protein [Clostridia bacterium]|nr:CapA family protein [Clostridia bacterium]
MNNKAVKVFLSIILALVVVIGGVAVGLTLKNGRQEIKPAAAPVFGKADKDETAPSEVPTEAPTETKAPVTLRMLSVGDNLIHDGIYEQAKKRAGGNGYDFSYCYARVKDTIASADVATINQETIVAKSYAPSGYPLFNSPQELGQTVVDTGFDVVNLANNHMLDKTSKGLAEAIDFWDATGLARTGAYKDTQDLESVEYIEKNGLKIGLVGITQYTNGLTLPSDSPLKYILTSDEATIERKIKAAKAQCDVVLVNVHWGSEYTTTPAQEQRNLAKKMADWGANVIIGHHPHVLQPVEWIENSDGTRTLVAYSLGNFISQQNTAARVIGGMLHYDITKDFETGKVTVSNVRFETIVTHYVSGSHDVQIYPLSQYSDTLAKKQAARIKQSDFSVAYIENFVKEVIPEEFLTA